jgi:hypoxanthine phosphoribosyltransferase
MQSREPAVLTSEELSRMLARATLVHSAERIDEAIARLAVELDRRLEGRVPLLVCVMSGALMFAGRLMARMRTFCELDYLQTSRYRRETRGGRLDWRVRPQTPLRGREVVLIDDIFDEGHTLAAIHRHCEAEGAARVLSVVLLDKVHDRKIAAYRPDLVGLEVPDAFVVGFGMDWSGYFRHLPAVHALALEEQP